MEKYKLIDRTGKRITCPNYNMAARIQRGLQTRGIQTTLYAPVRFNPKQGH